VSTAYLNRVNALNLPLCDIESLIARQVAQLVDKHAAEFVGVQETRALLSALEVEFPDLVKESLALVPIQRITQVFKRLLVEGVSIRNSRAILEAIVVAGQVDKDPVTLTEAVRVQLRRQISHRYSDDRNILPALLLDAATEAMMTTCVRQTPQGGYLALEAEPLAQLLSWLRQAVAKSMPGKAPVIVTSAILRRYLRDLISTEHCVVPVLSFQEMTPEVVLQPLDHIKIEPSRGD
jgi:type III secretion protein V